MDVGGEGWLTHVRHVLVALNAIWHLFNNPPIILPPVSDCLTDA